MPPKNNHHRTWSLNMKAVSSGMKPMVDLEVAERLLTGESTGALKAQEEIWWKGSHSKPEATIEQEIEWVME